LINYIKQQHAKGFTKEEVRTQLLSAGWEQKTVDKYITQTLVKEKSFEESKEFVELFARYGKFLTEGEEIKFKYDIGLYHVVITTKRLILLRKWPKALIEFTLENIDIVEYYTDIKTYKGVWGVAYLIGGGFFYMFNDVLWQRLALILPITQTFLNTKFFFGMNTVALIIFLYCLSMGIYDLVTFLLSFIGRVRVMPKNLGPTDLISQMTPQVEEFIQTMQESMGHGTVTKKQNTQN
jgi:hypothetical protein